MCAEKPVEVVADGPSSAPVLGVEVKQPGSAKENNNSVESATVVIENSVHGTTGGVSTATMGEMSADEAISVSFEPQAVSVVGESAAFAPSFIFALESDEQVSVLVID